MILLPSTDEKIRGWFDKQREEVKETECPVLDPLVIGISRAEVTVVICLARCVGAVVRAIDGAAAF